MPKITSTQKYEFRHHNLTLEVGENELADELFTGPLKNYLDDLARHDVITIDGYKPPPKPVATPPGGVRPAPAKEQPNPLPQITREEAGRVGLLPDAKPTKSADVAPKTVTPEVVEAQHDPDVSSSSDAPEGRRTRR